MKKAKYILFSFILLFISLNSLLAITSSGTIPDSEKEFIWYKGKSCGNGTEVNYSPLGAFYSAYTSNTQKKYNYSISTEIYTDEVYAKRACDNFVNHEENKDYLCTGTKSTSGYACYKDGIVTFEIDGRTYENINTDGGRMYVTEKDCLDNCSGTCKIQKAYNYEYAKEISTEETTSGSYIPIVGQIYSTKDGDPAFCIQPGKGIQCNGENNNSSQYCLNDTFDLSICSTAKGYNGDYRCGLANIVLRATKLNNDGNDKLTDDEYAVADVAMRMWAAYKGNLSGTQFDGLPTIEGYASSNSISEKIYMSNFIFSLTSKKVAQNSYYLNNGMTCSSDYRNIGIMCHCTNNQCKYTQTEYKKALQLFNIALTTNELDSVGNKISELITKKIDSTTEEIVITNVCESEDECEYKLIIKDAEGNEVASFEDPKCSKNICTFEKIPSLIEKTCLKKSEKYYAYIEISNMKFDGTIKEYHHCTLPTQKQIMIVFEAAAEEVIDNFTKSYEINIDCEETCTKDDKVLQTTVTSENINGSKNESITSCDGYKEYGKGDYDGYDKITISEPQLNDILENCDKNNFRETKYEANGGGYCQVYCRKDTVIYLADKTKVLSGMNFSYKLEEQIPNSGKSDQHISSIVQIKKECVSVIDYNKWKEDLENLLKQVADAWSEYKRWEALRANEDKKDQTFIYISDPTCSVGCDAITNENESGKTVCNSGSNKGDDGNSKSLGTKAVSWKNPCTGRGASSIISSTGVCNPSCSYAYAWKTTDYPKCKYYGNGSLSCDKSTSAASSGTIGKSTLSCKASTNGCSYTVSCDSNCTSYQNNKGPGNHIEKYGKTFEINVNSDNTKSMCEQDYTNYCNKFSGVWNCYWDKKNNSQDNKNKNKNALPMSTIAAISNSQKGSCYITNSQKVSATCTYTSSGACKQGTNGDPDHVKNNLSAAADKYYSLQYQVQQLIHNLENCNLYGSSDWIPGDPKFNYWKLTKGTADNPGPGSSAPAGVAGQNYTSDTPSTYEVVDGDKDSAFLQSYDFTKDIENSYAYSEISNKYANIKLATTSFDNTIIKKNILSDAACLTDGSCPELTVEYEDEKYGKSLKYSKVINVVEGDDINNKYCKNGNCDLKSSDVMEKINLILCNDEGKDVTSKTCEIKKEYISSADKAYFTTTTEIMYYRPTEYYAENYTGNAISVSTNTRVDSTKYSFIGRNIYPISNVKTDIYNIQYKFTGIGSGKYYNISKYNSTGLNLNNFEYTCAYEAYNQTTNPSPCSTKECEISQNGVPDVSETTCEIVTEEEKKGIGFMYRNVSLSNLFPNNRTIGNNWTTKEAQSVTQNIQANADTIYSEDNLDLSVTLTTDSIKKIREYNNSRENGSGGYLDDSLNNCEQIKLEDGSGYRFANCKSSFIDEINENSGVLGIKVNKINRESKIIKSKEVSK